jgi:hypothetical protein
MARVYLFRHDESNDQVDRQSIRGVEVYRFGQFHQCAAAFVDTANATSRECDSFLQTRATEALTLDQLRKNFFDCNVRIVPGKELAEYFQTMLLAASIYVTEYVVRLDDLFKNHGATPGYSCFWNLDEKTRENKPLCVHAGLFID